MELCFNRLRSVGEVFKGLGIYGVKKFELIDPQFNEALRISEACGKLTPALLGINAVVAYMITNKGEEFWHSFSEFSIRRCREKDIVDLVIEFTRRNNLFNVRNKLRRLSKLRNCPELMESIERHDLIKYWETLAQCLRVSKKSKTIVFSVKMVYYGLRAIGADMELPGEAPIPVDRRISLLTVSSGTISPSNCGSLVTQSIHQLRKASKALMKKPNLVRKVWGGIAQISKVPSLHLDAPLWVIGRYSYLGRKKKILDTVVKSLSFINDEISTELLKELINELYYRLPP